MRNNRSWLARGVLKEVAGRCWGKALYIESRSPWENGYIERFNGQLRDKLLDREIFYTLPDVKVLTAQYRQTYDRIRRHGSLG